MTQDDMTENAIAQETLGKARYFHWQAKLAEQSADVLTYRLPFSANLEAAIIYAQASIEHLKAEFAPKYNSRGYRVWHDDAWNRFRASDRPSSISMIAVTLFFTESRNRPPFTSI
jgi:hypothetical protein